MQSLKTNFVVGGIIIGDEFSTWHGAVRFPTLLYVSLVEVSIIVNSM